MRMRIDHYLSDQFLKDAIYKYLEFLERDERPTKAGFLEHVRNNVESFGSDSDSCWGVDFDSNVPSVEYFFKRWFIDKR